MSSEQYAFEQEAEQHIQACLMAVQAPQQSLDVLEKILEENSERAKAVALRLLDDNMIRNWFRSEADPSFIDEVRKRLELHFDDPAFVEAAMGRIQDAVKATPGTPGATVRKAPSKRHSALKYLLVPLGAALLYIGLAYHQNIIGFFRSSINETMTVKEFAGQPTVTTAEKDKAIIRKMLVRPGDTLSTSSSDKISLSYPDNSTLELGGSARLSLGKERGQKRLTFESGSLTLTVLPQPKDRPVLIETPHGKATIHEAQCIIVIADNVDTIRVAAGSIEVSKLTGGGVIPVTAGQTATIRAKQIIVRSDEN